MRTRPLALVFALALSACGGNWSNQDLEYLNAVPERETLISKLPQPAMGLSGEGTRRDGLMVGEASRTYADTRGASNAFNGILDFVLTVLDQVRQLPFTRRTENSRIWGPWDDRRNPGFEFQVVIERIDASNFRYAFQHRARGETEFFDSVTGHFRASEQLRRGQGDFVVHFKAVSSRLETAKLFAALEEARIGYITDRFPTRVEMTFTAVDPKAIISSVGYTYRELADRSGQIRFALAGPDANISEIETTSMWRPSGAGQAVTTITRGNFQGARQVECWSDAFLVTHGSQNWPGGITVGDVASCVTVPGL